ncbi:cytochrome c biogenesis protein ResB [Roseimicrobium sp. ORNL1]|uniref:cytochrome c biogenesis protein ResB n=1 Tax=Roseimicrobium sp. ORNL1 TaxID=2711231 RepID=UPI0013E136FA|nr:cytochrome c biogenesis protein ResB [Roseimicrobium sp. ORNL1]QIF04024.1 cytochrome c biogenesis protein ResB [Roseimicrobium sp. ORNL1]
MKKDSVTAPKAPSFPSRVFNIFASFGFAVVVLTLLLLMTFLGTLEQLEHGLYESQRKYFESWYIYNIDIDCCLRAMQIPYEGEWVLPIFLPGGGLLMGLLALNMICGGITRIILRIRAGLKNSVMPNFGLIGVLIAHVSVVFMLLAGLVSLLGKSEGAVWVTENQTVDEFNAFHVSAIQIEKLEPAPKDGKRVAMMIPDSQFDDLTKGKARTFYNDSLPFDLMVMNYMPNSTVRPAKPSDPQSMVVDGFILQELPVRDAEGKPLQHEQLVNGAYVKAIDKKTKAEHLGIVFRLERAPWTVTIGDESYGVSIGRRQYPLPFEVKLDKFVRETHPGTNMARKFTSHVTVIRDGKSEEKVITMNEPLRYGGYAFFQSSFDAEAADHGGQQSSMFQVASNPSDHWPLIALIAAMIGLLMNLVWHLLKFLGQSARKTAPVAPPSV